MQPNSHFYDWLRRRGITDEVISLFEIRKGDHVSLGECLVIPIKDTENKLIFNKYRRDPNDHKTPKYLYDKGGEVTLYGAFLAKGHKTILITEGEMDALVAWSAKIPAVTSTGGALSFQEKWVSFFENKNTYLCFDNDESGGKGMVRVLKMLPQAKIVFLPDAPNIKDISDYVAHGGNLNKLLDTAKQFSCSSDIHQDRYARLALFKSTFFHDAWIEDEEKSLFVSSEYQNSGRTDIEKARLYPIGNLIKLQRGANIKCLWHEERTGSLHYYPKTNSLYCFGMCGKAYDVIDVYQKLNNCGFKEAVKEILKLL